MGKLNSSLAISSVSESRPASNLPLHQLCAGAEVSDNELVCQFQPWPNLGAHHDATSNLGFEKSPDWLERQVVLSSDAHSMISGFRWA
jgi:hypothetical protein